MIKQNISNLLFLDSYRIHDEGKGFLLRSESCLLRILFRDEPRTVLMIRTEISAFSAFCLGEHGFATVFGVVQTVRD